MRSLSGTRPFNRRYSSGELRHVYLTVICPVVDRSQVRSNGHQRIHTGYLQDAERTRTGQTAYKRTSNVHPPDIFIRWRPFEHVQNLPTDKTGQNGHHLTRNAFTARGTDEKRMRTDTNGQRILLSVTRPLALSGKV